MRKKTHIFGKESELSGLEAIQLLEAGICEGLLVKKMNIASTNIYGRKVQQHHSSNLSFLRGLASTGLRGAAILSESDLSKNWSLLQSIAREHLAAVAIIIPGSEAVSTNGSGWFQLIASDPEEAINLALLSHWIAEKALIPGMLLLDFDHTKVHNIRLPKEEAIQEFLISPDDYIEPPTPAQKMLFGKTRRQIPNWFNFDFPAFQGMLKKGNSKALEIAARERFFNAHLPEIMEEGFNKIRDWSGRAIQSVSQFQNNRADHIILVSGELSIPAREAVEYLQKKEQKKIGLVNICQFRPFPIEDLTELLKGKKTISVLERQDAHKIGTAPLFKEIQTLLPKLGKRAAKLYSGLFGETPGTQTILKLLKKQIKGSLPQEQIFLDLPFTQEAINPTNEVLMQTISRAYPGIDEESIQANRMYDTANNTIGKQGLPFVIRRYQDQGPPFSRLSRFYSDTVSYFRGGQEHTLPADPFQSLPLAPAASANFNENAIGIQQVPVFHPESCTACGDCLVRCPYSAMPSIAIGVEGLLKGAMDIASKKGLKLHVLTPLVKNLALLAGKAIKKGDSQISRAAQFLPEAFETLVRQMKLSGEKLEQSRQAFEAALELIKDFPLALEETFFSKTNSLFSIAIDPNACVGCGLCADICTEDALSMEDNSPALLNEMQRNFSLWEQLPDTSGETIQKLEQGKNIHPFAPILLSRNFYHSMSGAGQGKAPSLQTIHHLLTATTESVMQPRMAKQLKGLDKLISQLAENIHDKLSDAIPKDDFSAISNAIQYNQSNRLSLNELVSNLDSDDQLKLLNTNSLQRKISLLDDLKELRNLLSKGPTGTGRARYGLLLTEEKDIYDYPFNPFTAPVTLHIDGSNVEGIEGLLKGHLRHLLDNIRLWRRSELEANDKYRPELHDEEIASLEWKDLSEIEKSLVPPILLFGKSAQLGTQDMQGVYELINTDWPLNIFLLTEGLTTPERKPELPSISAILANTKARIFQSTLEAPDHFFNCLRESLIDSRPALGFIQCGTEPGAVESRAFPIFKYIPKTGDEFLSTALHVDENPSANEEWHNGITLAHWLYTQDAWATHFHTFGAEKKGIPLSEYLQLSAEARKNKTPFIYSSNEERITISNQVLELTELILRQWNNLRELAGKLIPFPEKLREEVTKELSEKYQEDLRNMKAEYDQKIQSREQEYMQELKIKLREKLLALSKR